ncbi:putative WRKY transcription factor 14 [Dorcoceras hygrometricum]|uniref:Putative WRKY transcription factor 14 n=1 Tax=Dorcoceras hygrometricum TaxID=472368 RepID=A0A2Z7AKM1_9LAMI|nr:putative WRKY transcription factor 14 [Dorcoceras hygrometricum]
MENYQGDLSDVIRRKGCSIESGSAEQEWQFPNNQMNYSDEYFGDPFADLRDPFLDTSPPVSGFLHEEDEMKRPSNTFSRMLPVAAAASDQSLKAGCSFMDIPAAPLRIPSPRNTAIKRRKSQAKKVVCIPAPAPANSRPTGEIVPSDLWAWRKYGQKPIKGSPYPRGYYRCSSSKGCSARKQVERSRTDPNMLVITYTSEHNHPWPTQRNALAGSTRSQTSKSTCTSKNSSNSLPQKSANPREEKKKMTKQLPIQENINNPVSVKEEMDEDFVNNLEMEVQADFDEAVLMPPSYKPTMPDSSKSEESNFFVEIGEMESDPLNLLFAQDGLICGGENKSLDPFSIYDWGSSSINTSISTCTSSYAETKKDS